MESRSKRWHSIEEWHNRNRQYYRTVVDRGVSAEKLIEHSERIQERVKESIVKKKNETEWLFRGRIKDVNFQRAELESVRCSIQEELECLDILQKRIQDEINCVDKNAGEIVQKCMEFRVSRKGRVGIDLIHDEVEKELEAEKKKILDSDKLLRKALEQTQESKRDLRASMYLLNKDVKGKLDCLAIEFECLSLKDSDESLKTYKGHESFDKGNVTIEEWTRYSQETIKSAQRKIQTARLFQIHTKLLLEEIMNDLTEQFFRVNDAFERRIQEIMEAKARLVEQHREMTRQVNDMKVNVANLEKSIDDKERYLALAQTRLEKRSNRPGIELVKDQVEASLVGEILEIKDSIAELIQLHAEVHRDELLNAKNAEKAMRYLLEGQMHLEEEINRKIINLKIDEVDCLTIRQNINYHYF